MKKSAILLSILVAACGDDGNNVVCGDGTTLMNGMCVGSGGGATCGSGTMLDTATNMCVVTTTTPTFVQVEHLARPGINEALVLSNTSLAVSAYLNLCGDPSMPQPLLCGGRFLTDDVIDITYNYLFAGAAITPAAPAQFRALVADGVGFNSGTTGNGQISTFDDTNPN